MKRKLYRLAMAFVLLILSGCSLVEDVNQSLDYTDEATAFINETVTFANRIPELAQEAANNSGAKEKLTEHLENMKQRISEFNQLEAPAFARDIHEKLTGYTDTLSLQINDYLAQIKEGVTDFKNTEISQTLQQLQDTLEQVRNLQP
ncbi:DUF6376 family protein [Paenibacillus sp. DMB20]|uniref:DUF6376 family protein n=1 Tax=Paenibacillus sp. DMB20 TaxID=1642570 RepID=UPI0006279605|nr:DUF6376 family protein [Paenibacillus sp. DMB20]KKO55178.1 hypothetical protein XI25_02130 [Paenibacillus sp. DMB20]